MELIYSILWEFVKPLVESLGWLGVVLTILGAFNALAIIRKDRFYRNSWRHWLEHGVLEKLYKDLLGSFLQFLSVKVIGDNITAQAYTGKDTSSITNRLFGCKPFTEKSVQFTLRLALAYPIIAFFLFWLAGSTGSMAGIDLLDQAPAHLKLLTILILVLFTWLYSMGLKIGGWQGASMLAVAVALLADKLYQKAWQRDRLHWYWPFYILL